MEELNRFRQYLAEGIIKEVMDEEMVDYVVNMFNMDVDDREEEGPQSGVWSRAEYSSDAYEDSKLFDDISDHLKSVGGKDVVEGNPDITIQLLRNGDIKWSANVTFS
jgi:hypothetical protein